MQGDLNVAEKQKMEEEVEEDLEVEGEGDGAMFSARNGKELKNALKTASLLKDVSQIPKGRGIMWEIPPSFGNFPQIFPFFF